MVNMFRIRLMLRLLVASLLTWSTFAAELHIQHGVIQRALASTVFTDEGRKYVKGSRSTRCSFAYLENPEVGSEGGQLRIRARFTGRSAGDFFGRCIGMGDSFLLIIRATPYFQDGQIRLKNVSVRGDREGFYIRRVCTTMAGSLERDVKVDVGTEAKKVLQEPAPNAFYRQELRDFRVLSVRVTNDSLVLEVDLKLFVRP